MLGFYWGYTGIMENQRILLFRGLGLWDLGWAAEDSGVQVTGAYPLSLGVWGCLASDHSGEVLVGLHVGLTQRRE